MGNGIDDCLAGFPAVSLPELEERALLLRRVDRKYAVERGIFAELMGELRNDHEVLEIEGRRCFAYRNVYFDSPDLRCFWDHVNDRAPRFKARTRLYRDTGSCVFEVKLKREGGEMDKRQINHDPERSDRLTPEALGCLEEALSDAGLHAADNLAPTLQTSFRRITLAATASSERLTCDLGVSLSTPDGKAAALAESIILVETKTDHGDGRANSSLAQLGVGEISLSKYRVGMSLVGSVPVDEPQPGSDLFELVR